GNRGDLIHDQGETRPALRGAWARRGAHATWRAWRVIRSRPPSALGRAAPCRAEAVGAARGALARCTTAVPRGGSPPSDGAGDGSPAIPPARAAPPPAGRRVVQRRLSWRRGDAVDRAGRLPTRPPLALPG